MHALYVTVTYPFIGSTTNPRGRCTTVAMTTDRRAPSNSATSMRCLPSSVQYNLSLIQSTAMEPILRS